MGELKYYINPIISRDEFSYNNSLLILVRLIYLNFCSSYFIREIRREATASRVKKRLQGVTKALKMASGETIHRSYECLPLLGIFFVCKKR